MAPAASLSFRNRRPALTTLSIIAFVTSSSDSNTLPHVRDTCEVGERIRHYRASKNLTQVRLAEIMNAARPYLADIERGKREPSYNFLRKLLEATGISSEWLPRGTGPMISDMYMPEAGGRLDIDFLAEAGLEKLDCGLYAIGDKVYVPLSNIEACCGTGFDVFNEYTIEDAIAANRKEVGALRSDMLPYAVKTEGRSMEGYGIKENSTVIVNPAEDAYAGCVALVVLGGKASIKKI